MKPVDAPQCYLSICRQCVAPEVDLRKCTFASQCNANKAEPTLKCFRQSHSLSWSFLRNNNHHFLIVKQMRPNVYPTKLITKHESIICKVLYAIEGQYLVSSSFYHQYSNKWLSWWGINPGEGGSCGGGGGELSGVRDGRWSRSTLKLWTTWITSQLLRPGHLPLKPHQQISDTRQLWLK